MSGKIGGPWDKPSPPRKLYPARCRNCRVSIPEMIGSGDGGRILPGDFYKNFCAQHQSCRYCGTPLREQLWLHAGWCEQCRDRGQADSQLERDNQRVAQSRALLRTAATLIGISAVVLALVVVGILKFF